MTGEQNLFAFLQHACGATISLTQIFEANPRPWLDPDEPITAKSRVTESGMVALSAALIACGWLRGGETSRHAQVGNSARVLDALATAARVALDELTQSMNPKSVIPRLGWRVDETVLLLALFAVECRRRQRLSLW